MRNKFLRIPFAADGDKSSFPDATDLTGSVSYTQGWGPDYQRDQETDPLAKDIDRATMNYLMNVVTANMQQYQTEGIPEWIAAEDNNSVSYSYDAGIIVRYRASTGDAFTQWVSLVAGNTATPGTDATKWQPFITVEASAAEAAAGTASDKIMTPRRVATAIAALSSGINIGDAVLRFVNNIPSNFLEANGAAISRTTYAALFAAIDTTWGAGDGTTTFNLPDARGEFLRGFDNGRGADFGRVFGTSQSDLLKSHFHMQRGNPTAAFAAGTTFNAADASNATDMGPTGSTGGSETRPRNITAKVLIKYK